MASGTLHSLFVEEIRDLYNAEKQLTRALPKMARNASSQALKSAIEEHLEETRGQVERLERVFDLLEERPRGKHCAGMAGIIEEAGDMLEEEEDGPVLDAGIIAGAQRAEHYEMAAYGTAVAWADAMGHREIAQLLGETLEEEKAADAKLSSLAMRGINDAANGGMTPEEMIPSRGNGRRASGAAGRTATRR